MLSSREHQAVKRGTKIVRSAAGRAWRGTLSAKLADVTLIPIALPDGTDALLALTAVELAGGRAHILRRQGERWACLCFAAVHSVQRDCAHQAAAREWDARQGASDAA